VLWFSMSVAIVECTGIQASVQILNLLGRERNRALVRKQAGRGVKSSGRGAVHYSENKRHDPHEEAALQFAKMLTDFLECEHQRNNFKSLTIVAEPHFLGKLRGTMRPSIQETVTEWVKKDLLKTPQNKLVEILFPIKNELSPEIDSFEARADQFSSQT